MDKGHEVVDKGHEVVDKGRMIVEKGREIVEKGRMTEKARSSVQAHLPIELACVEEKKTHQSTHPLTPCQNSSEDSVQHY